MIEIKAWQYIMREMFEGTEEVYKYNETRCPNRTKQEMKEVIQEEGISIQELISFLPGMYKYKTKAGSIDELFEIEIHEFNPIVIKGSNRKSEQIGIEEILKFKPVIVK